jgi:stage II sporulation protein D
LLDSGKKLQVNNLVPLESYVQSVLGPKSSPIWPDEAIKAQAVAVRSFAYARMQASDQAYALRASDQICIMAAAVLKILIISKLAATTRGEVLYYDATPALAYTTESSGGKTESAAVALGKSIPYLVSVQDYDEDSPSFKWTKTISVADVESILAQNGYNLGKLKSYRLSPLKGALWRRSFCYRRVLTMYLKGNAGDAQLSGTELAAILNLNSTLFDVSATRVMPSKIDIPIENPYGMEIGRKEVPIKVNGDDEPRWKQVLPGYVLLNGSAG